MGDWVDVIDNGIYQAGSILGTRYAVPQLAPGQYYSQSPSGAMTTFQNATGSSSFGLPSIGGSSSLLLWGGAALVLILLMSKR
jgi:hypothetical protein